MLPALLVLLWFYFYRLDIILLLITAATPLAINVVQYELGAGMSLPTEPLLFGVLILFILKLFYKNDFDPKDMEAPAFNHHTSAAWLDADHIDHQPDPPCFIQIPSFKALVRDTFLFPCYPLVQECEKYTVVHVALRCATAYRDRLYGL